MAFAKMQGISKKWEPRHRTFGGLQDLGPKTHLMGETWDPTPWTLKVGTETQDLELNS